MDNVGDKNPAKNNGATPLYLAAQEGHFDVCKLIMEKVDRKNPARKDGWNSNKIMNADLLKIEDV